MPSLNDWQPELFQEFQAPTKPPWWSRYWRPSQRFMVLRLAHEDLILGVIGAIMVVMLGFCLGVERGKRLVLVASVAPPPAFAPAAPAMVLPLLPASQPLAPPAPPAIRPPIVQQRAVTTADGPTKLAAALGQRYVVQVASFTARDQAVAAQQRLSQRGVRAALATKGKYHVVYAGGFATYAQATAAADRLRPTYRDCFVRKQHVVAS